MSEMGSAALQEMASEYAAYVSLDTASEMKEVYEAVEEMQLRLEEFASIVQMMRGKNDKSISENIPRFLALRPQVNSLCKRVDALDFFITRVSLDLATLEANMELAESSLGSTENKFTAFNPFSFFKKVNESSSSGAPQPTYQPPHIFQIDDYFNSEP